MAKKKGCRDKIEAMIPDTDAVFVLKNNSFFFQWCCDCGLRHIWHYRVERGETPAEDVVVVSGERDEIATRLRRARKRARSAR